MKTTHSIETYLPGGEPLVRFRVENAGGNAMEFTNLGARWVAAYVADAQGRRANVLLGYRDLAAYADDAWYLGATVGRVANRIAGARFVLEGRTYHLEANDGRNTNHGGFSGLHRKCWQWEELPDGVCFRTVSPDGEGGYPGRLTVTAAYHFSEDNELLVVHRAVTDAPTYVNLTNHAYFNLSGCPQQRVTGHWLQIPSHYILETTADFLPTGRLTGVKDTPFDFTRGKPLGQDLAADHEQLRWNRGYNHCYVLGQEAGASAMRPAARLWEPDSGRCLRVRTDLPAVLLYTAGFYERPHTGVCLETQFYPDTPSHPRFPSCLLRPGEVYEHRTSFRFGVEKRG